jgi:hypothetical protein
MPNRIAVEVLVRGTRRAPAARRSARTRWRTRPTRRPRWRRRPQEPRRHAGDIVNVTQVELALAPRVARAGARDERLVGLLRLAAFLDRRHRANNGEGGSGGARRRHRDLGTGGERRPPRVRAATRADRLICSRISTACVPGEPLRPARRSYGYEGGRGMSFLAGDRTQPRCPPAPARSSTEAPFIDGGWFSDAGRRAVVGRLSPTISSHLRVRPRRAERVAQRREWCAGLSRLQFMRAAQGGRRACRCGSRVSARTSSET